MPPCGWLFSAMTRLLLAHLLNRGRPCFLKSAASASRKSLLNDLRVASKDPGTHLPHAHPSSFEILVELDHGDGSGVLVATIGSGDCGMTWRRAGADAAVGYFYAHSTRNMRIEWGSQAWDAYIWGRAAKGWERIADSSLARLSALHRASPDAERLNSD